jgi:hypothetical protein
MLACLHPGGSSEAKVGSSYFLYIPCTEGVAFVESVNADWACM